MSFWKMAISLFISSFWQHTFSLADVKIKLISASALSWRKLFSGKVACFSQASGQNIRQNWHLEKYLGEGGEKSVLSKRRDEEANCHFPKRHFHFSSWLFSFAAESVSCWKGLSSHDKLCGLTRREERRFTREKYDGENSLNCVFKFFYFILQLLRYYTTLSSFIRAWYHSLFIIK